MDKKSLLAAMVLILAAGCCGPRPPAPPAVSGRTAPPPDFPPAAPPPIYREPKIGMVILRAHEDAEGRLLGPQVMYQVVDPGGWDIAALEDRGTVPPPAREDPADLGAAPSDPLLDPAQAARIVITGLMRPEDRPQAEALAAQRGGGWSADFDREAGWLLLPPDAQPGAPHP